MMVGISKWKTIGCSKFSNIKDISFYNTKAERLFQSILEKNHVSKIKVILLNHPKIQYTLIAYFLCMPVNGVYIHWVIIISQVLDKSHGNKDEYT